MSEKQKMQQELLYNANHDAELLNERNKCKNLCFKFNHTPYEDAETRQTILRELFGQVKKNVIIEPSFWCDYGYNIKLGENFYSNHNLVILDEAEVVFGDNVFIGPNCGFYTAGHPLNIAQRNQGLEYAKPIKVGHNVWFGANVIVLPGVVIGDSCTIGAGSVVVKDIPANSVAVGNPCRVIRQVDK